jgi:predicted component of type VI protein secretion system
VDAILTIVQADGRTQDIRLKRPRTVVGRKPECNIRVPVSSVSREHCEVLLTDDAVQVRDLGSSNGTYINRERVQEATLKAGDLLGVGPAVFVLRIDGQPAKIDAAQARARGAAPEPVAAAPAPMGRPASPTKPVPAKPAGKPAPAKPSLSDEGESDDSSVDFDFDEFLKDDDDAKL